MNVARRLDAFLSGGASRHVIVTNNDDIRWLTGFSGSTSQLFVDRHTGESILFVDGRYTERAAVELDASSSSTHVCEVSATSTMVQQLQARGVVEVAINFHHISAARFHDLRDVFKVSDESTVLSELRRSKDAEEVAAIEMAARIADAALAHVMRDGILGDTEKQVRFRLENAMNELGADDVSFPTIVATGSNGARPHHEPTDTVIADGDCVVVDLGACVDGYRSDMTRSIRVGQWSDAYLQMFSTVKKAQQAGVDVVRAGCVGSDVDAAVRRVFREAGVEHEFVHGTGHGVGLYIHEDPILSPRCTATLSAGEVVTVEPGLYRKGVGGVRIEDLVVVTGTGCRILTLSPKELSCPRSQQTI